LIRNILEVNGEKKRKKKKEKRKKKKINFKVRVFV